MSSTPVGDKQLQAAPSNIIPTNHSAARIAQRHSSLFLVHLLIASVYPAKGRPGSKTSKLDSGTQKRLRRSRIEGYGPRPRPACDWSVPLSYHRPVFRRARELEPQATAHASVCRPWGLSQSNFAPFSECLHIKGWNFPDVFYPFTSTRQAAMLSFVKEDVMDSLL